MPKLDIIHDAVKNALAKDSWNINCVLSILVGAIHSFLLNLELLELSNRESRQSSDLFQ